MSRQHSEEVFSALKKINEIPQPSLVGPDYYEKIVRQSKNDATKLTFWKKHYHAAKVAQGKQKAAWRQFLAGFERNQKGQSKHIQGGLDRFKEELEKVLEIGQNDISAINGDIGSHPDYANSMFGRVETIPLRQPHLENQEEWEDVRDNYYLHTKLSTLYSEAYGLQLYRNTWLESTPYDEGQDEDIINLMLDINRELDQIVLPAKFQDISNFGYIHIPSDDSPQHDYEVKKEKSVKIDVPDEDEDYPEELFDILESIGGLDGSLRRYLQAVMQNNGSEIEKRRKELDKLERQLQQKAKELGYKHKVSLYIDTIEGYAESMSDANILYHRLQRSKTVPQKDERSEYLRSREFVQEWLDSHRFPENYIDSLAPLPKGIKETIRNPVLDKAMGQIGGEHGALNRFLWATYEKKSVPWDDQTAIDDFNKLIKNEKASEFYLPIAGDHLKDLLRGVEVMKELEANCRKDPTNKKPQKSLRETNNRVHDLWWEYTGYPQAIVGDILTSERYMRSSKGEVLPSVEDDNDDQATKPQSIFRKWGFGKMVPQSRSSSVNNGGSRGSRTNTPSRGNSVDGQRQPSVGDDGDRNYESGKSKSNYRQPSVEDENGHQERREESDPYETGKSPQNDNDDSGSINGSTGRHRGPAAESDSAEDEYRQRSESAQEPSATSKTSKRFEPENDFEPLVRNDSSTSKAKQHAYMSGGLKTPDESREGTRQNSAVDEDHHHGSQRTGGGPTKERQEHRRKRDEPQIPTPPASPPPNVHIEEQHEDVIPAPPAEVDYSKIRLKQHDPRIVTDEVNGRLTEMRILAWRAIGRKSTETTGRGISRPEDFFGMRGGQLCVKYQIPGMEEFAYNFVRSSKHKGALNAFVGDGGEHLEVSSRDELKGCSWFRTPLAGVMFAERDSQEIYVKSEDTAILIQPDGKGPFKWFWKSTAKREFGNHQVDLRIRTHLKKTGQVTSTIMPLKERKALIRAEERRRAEAGQMPLPPRGDIDRGRILKHVFRDGDARRWDHGPKRGSELYNQSTRKSSSRGSGSGSGQDNRQRSRPSGSHSRTRNHRYDSTRRQNSDGEQSERDDGSYGERGYNGDGGGGDSEGPGDSIHSEDQSEDEDPR